MNRSKTVYILRGLPGAGKSHWAAEQGFKPGINIISTDDFFMVDGEYRFNPARLGEAHNWNFTRFQQHLFNNVLAPVVIDNTNTRLWEYRNYKLLAIDMGWNVEIHQWVPRTLDDVRLCVATNVHDVPEEVILKMALHWEPTLEANSGVTVWEHKMGPYLREDQ